METAPFVDCEERIPLPTSTTYGYDNNGNMTSYTGGNTLTWNYKNQLTGSTIASTTATYVYDHTGQRVSMTSGGVTTIYPNNLYEKTGTSTLKNIYAGNDLVATVIGTGSTTASTTYIHADHLGSTKFVTDAYGNVIQSLDYAPFGAETTATGTPKTDRHFIGQISDASSLSYLQNRYYSGQRGQFLTQDPVFLALGDPGKTKSLTGQELNTILSDPQTLNSYSYAANNPITRSDPKGLWYQEFLSGQQSGSSFQIEVGQATQQLTNSSPAWNYAVNNPIKAGAVTGLVGGTAFLAGVPAAASFSSSVVNVSGVGRVLVTNRLIEGSLYTYLAADSLGNLPNKLNSASQLKSGDLKSYAKFTGGFLVDYVPNFAGEVPDALAGVTQMSKSAVDKISSFVKQQQQNNKKNNK